MYMVWARLVHPFYYLYILSISKFAVLSIEILKIIHHRLNIDLSFWFCSTLLFNFYVLSDITIHLQAASVYR